MELRLENLVKDFSGNKAVDTGSFTIQNGKLTGLLGPSGCGKSTLLYLIAGLQQPTSGRIYFGDKDVTNLPPEKRDIGLVFQNYALYPHLTVEQNIAFPLENRRVRKEEIAKRTREMAKLVHVDELLNRKPGQLSGGQQQRVAIARALVKKPAILLLDEPLSNLDARLRLEMREEIRRIQKETGVTTIFVTHDQEEAMSITDEIVLMKKGVIQQQCPPQEMYLNPANQFVASFLGNPPIDFFELPYQDGRIMLADGVSVGVKFVEADATGIGANAARTNVTQANTAAAKTDEKKINTANVNTGKTVFVGIRPEAWAAGTDFYVKAESVEQHGKDVLVSFRLAGVRTRAVLNVLDRIEQNQEFGLRLQNKLIYLFDRETGKRIPAEVSL